MKHWSDDYHDSLCPRDTDKNSGCACDFLGEAYDAARREFKNEIEFLRGEPGISDYTLNEVIDVLNGR